MGRVLAEGEDPTLPATVENGTATNIAANTRTLIYSHIVSSDVMTVDSIEVTGTTVARWEVFVNSQRRQSYRDFAIQNSNTPGSSLELGEIPVGSAIEIYVEHTDTSRAHNFSVVFKGTR